MKYHDEARQEAQARLLAIESDWKLEKRQIVTEYEQRLIYERDQFIEEINELRMKVNKNNQADQRKLKEILSQEYEFKANQREGLLREQIASLEAQIELEREVIEQTKDRELDEKLLHERLRLQEQ